MGIRLATHAHTLDVFACSLDQVGLAEMKTAVDQTGGVMVLAEQFRAETFRNRSLLIYPNPTLFSKP